MWLKPINNLFKLQFIFSLFLALSTIHCDKFWSSGSSTTTSTTTTTPSVPSHGLNACKLYRIQSYIIDCHKRSKYFNPVSSTDKESISQVELENRKKIIETACAQQAFSTILGLNMVPTSQRGLSQDRFFQWGIAVGNKVIGNIPRPPGPVELAYSQALNQFRLSINSQQMNSCLGGNYFGDGPTIVKTSFEAVHLGFLEAEVFRKCYKEQLELYKTKHSCPAI